MTPSKSRALSALLASIILTSSAGAVVPMPEKVPCAIPDKQDFQDPDRVHLSGWLGERMEGNEKERLLKVVKSEWLLDPYTNRRKTLGWSNEHLGKWMHAATLAWVNSGDPALREKLDKVASELMKCQLPDGYLGTYVDEDRWTAWDIWGQKYTLIGLITYGRYTGNKEAISACQRIADLLCKNVGDGPGQRDIIKGTPGVGLASTSVLEPMVLLYRLTGEPRYLDFCKYILRAWEQPNGPHVISALLSEKRVTKVGDSKAYEMLSCLNGALEYYRTTGDPKILGACLNAWQDIMIKRLYITGASSSGERFCDDFVLPNGGANVGETCVTVTWLQMNAQLLRLTGEARFSEQLEKVVLNQLLGAERPSCTGWGYYVQMEGRKPYGDFISCCISSGPRGIALIPSFAESTDASGIVVNLYNAGVAQLVLHDRTPVTVTTDTAYPDGGRVKMKVDPASPKKFAVKLRIPDWCSNPSVLINGDAAEAKRGADGYATLQRTWKSGDTINLNLKLKGRVVIGDHANAGKAAVCYGPLVLAADESLLALDKQVISEISIPETSGVTLEPAPEKLKTWPGEQVYHINTTAHRTTDQVKAGSPMDVRLVSFGDAGGAGGHYKIWLPLAGPANPDILLDGEESRSSYGNLNESINDGNLQACVTTFSGKPQKEAWFAVTLDTLLPIRRVVYAHGKSFHDGGWFVGKPKVQVQRTEGGQWETVGELSDYAADGSKLKPGQTFTLQLAQPVKVMAVRVLGVPASGDTPTQAFASCAELQAFGE